MWKYYIELLNEKNYEDIVEAAETSDGLPLCRDYNVAIEFDSPDELNKWVKENTSLNAEKMEYKITGIYYPEKCMIEE